MQILDVSSLKPGAAYPEPLFHISGRKLLAANTKLTTLHLEALVRSSITQVYLAPSAEPVLALAQTQLRQIPVGELQLGMVADTDLLTPDGMVIIQQHEQVEEHHIAALRDSGIPCVFARPPVDIESLRNQMHEMLRVVSNRIDGQIRRGEYLRTPEARDPFIREIAHSGGGDGEQLSGNAIQLLRRRLTARLQPLYGKLETGRSPDEKPLNEIADDLMDLMKSQPRQFTQLVTMTSRREDYLPDHAISVAVLAMAVAAHMQLARDMVRQVILGALLFDVGMLMVPKRIRVSSGTLSEADREKVHSHPLYSVAMMEQITGLTQIPRLIGYQHHERLNGQGYPAAAAAASISDFARIVAAADVFAASVNPRSYKSAKLPYNAMEEVVIMAHRGLLDTRVVKALLSAVGLFPVGSYVMLSNQTAAQVVGADPAKIDRPLVRVLKNGLAYGPVLDLTAPKYGHLKVVKAVPPPTQAAELQLV